LNRKDKVTK